MLLKIGIDWGWSARAAAATRSSARSHSNKFGFLAALAMSLAAMVCKFWRGIRRVGFEQKSGMRSESVDIVQNLDCE